MGALLMEWARSLGGLLMPFAQWLEGTPWAVPVRESLWVYPVVQLIHFGGLSIWIGTNLLVDLRLMGIGRRKQTAAQLLDYTFVWNWIGFAIVLTGGLLLFSPLATSFLTNPAFLAKLTYLVPLALIWHIIVQIKTPRWGAKEQTALPGRLAGALEICLWLGVAFAAVLIPTY